MKLGLVGKEFLAYRRDRRFVIVLAMLLTLMLVAGLEGGSRTRDAASNVAAAAAADREVWVEQGPNNPHGAAHFARYAFRPQPPLAAFDPGIQDFAGAAVWMEAHYQNPASLRRAEDLAGAVPFAAVDPGWVLRVIGSLVLVALLFAAIAGEREQGTLKMLLAQGFTAGQLLTAKLAAALTTVAGITGAALLLALVPALGSSGAAFEPARVVLLIVAYAAGLATFAGLVIAVSALAAHRSAALVTALVIWLVTVVAVPVGAAQVAASLHPTPDARSFAERIQLESQSPFWVGDAREPAVAAYESIVLQRHGATSWEELGFDREALVLQAHEEFANEVFDRLYGALYEAHRAQEALLSRAAWLSPTLAVERISAGLAGTDLLAQQSFLRSAEQHRRLIVEQLNRDMMEKAGSQGYAYRADRELWESIPDHEPALPGLGAVLAHYRQEWLALAIWLVVALALAWRLSDRSLRRALR